MQLEASTLSVEQGEMFTEQEWTITVPTESYLEYEDNICIAGYDGMNLLRYK